MLHTKQKRTTQNWEQLYRGEDLATENGDKPNEGHVISGGAPDSNSVCGRNWHVYSTGGEREGGERERERERGGE